MTDTIENLQLDTLSSASGFCFSGAKLDDLGAAEYTLAILVRDNSGSVQPFVNELDQLGQTVAETCRKSPRAENILIRSTIFGSQVSEHHGFKPLAAIGPDEYKGTRTSGCTALNDAIVEAVDTAVSYAQSLAGRDIICNCIVFVVSDGEENASNAVPTVAGVKSRLEKARKAEELESLSVILIGLSDPNDSPASYARTMQILNDYTKDAGLTQFVEVGAATPKQLAKLAQFVAGSISSTSQALGSGGPSQPLTF